VQTVQTASRYLHAAQVGGLSNPALSRCSYFGTAAVVIAFEAENAVDALQTGLLRAVGAESDEEDLIARIVGKTFEGAGQAVSALNNVFIELLGQNLVRFAFTEDMLSELGIDFSELPEIVVPFPIILNF